MRQHSRGLAPTHQTNVIFTSTNAICSLQEPSPPPLSVKFAMFAHLACTTSQRFIHKYSANSPASHSPAHSFADMAPQPSPTNIAVCIACSTRTICEPMLCVTTASPPPISSFPTQLRGRPWMLLLLLFFCATAPSASSPTINVADTERRCVGRLAPPPRRHLSPHHCTPPLWPPSSHAAVLYRYGNAEFQSSIRRFVPEGHTFKAFPLAPSTATPRSFGVVPPQPRCQRHFGDARRRRPRSLWGQAHGQGAGPPPPPAWPHRLPCV